MSTSIPRAVVALLASFFILAACAGDGGAEWTYAPVTPTETSAPAATEVPAGTLAPTATEAPAEQPAEPSQPSGEVRVIQLKADSSLRFTDPSGQQVTDIPVVPGETIRFEIENTAGFDHNFWIGTEGELMVPNAETDVGIPTWQTGIQTLEWTVPGDISGLQFACTVPGHYSTMHGTFSSGGAPQQAATPEQPAEPGQPAASEPAQPAGEARVIELEADSSIRFLQDGQQIREIPVTPGETVIFRINNTANFAHNFRIGPDEELQVPNGETDVGLDDWSSGVQELEWVVPQDISGLRFACTVPGHYFTMQGDFVVSQ